MELHDLYTKDRVRTGKTIPRGTEIPVGYYKLSVHICLFNQKGEMLIQQRQSFKQGWPNLWDMTVGGSAVAGEDSRTAAERELMEELGIAHSLADARPALTVHYSCGFDDIYLVEKSLELSTLILQPEEVPGSTVGRKRGNSKAN